MRIIFIVLIGLLSAPLAAKDVPAILSTEQTATSLCRDFKEPYADLIRLCQSALTEFDHTDNDLAILHNNLGYAQESMNQMEPALLSYQKALEYRPLYVEPWSNIGWLHWVQGEYKQAKVAFEKAQKISPSSSILAGLAGSIGRSTQDYETALEMLNTAIIIDPKNDWAYVEKGWVLRNLRRYSDAVDSFELALNLDPNYPSALYGTAKSYRNLGELEQALKFANRAIIEKEDSYYLTERSNILRRLDRPAQALKDAEKALKLDPGLDTAVTSASWALTDLGRTKDAINLFEKHKDEVGESNHFWYYYGDLLSDQSMWEEAENAIRTGIAIDDSFAEDHHLLGYILQKSGDCISALKAEERALEIEPESVYAHYNSSLCQLDLGQNEKAYTAIKAALELGLDEEDISDFMATAFSVGGVVFATRVGALLVKMGLSNK